MTTIADSAQVHTAAAERASRWRRDRMFYGAIALAAVLVVFAGFARGYYLRSFTGASALPTVVELHAALFSVWMLLFVVQVSLVTTRRTDLHRRLGMLGVGFAVALLGAGYLTAVTGVRTGWAGPLAPRDAAAALPFLAIPFGDLVLFAGFFGAAVYWRRQPETHKRLMMLAMIGGILPPALGRLPAVVGLIAALALLLAGPVYDRWSRGSIHRVYAWGIPIVLASIPVRLAIGSTDTWRRFALWFVQQG